MKIEGRARGPEYVDTVVRCYNEAIEAVLHDKKSFGDTIAAIRVEEPGSFREQRMTPEELENAYTAVFGRRQA